MHLGSCTCSPVVSSCKRNQNYFLFDIFFIVIQKYGNLFFLLQTEANYLAQLTRIVSLAEIDGEWVFWFDSTKQLLVNIFDFNLDNCLLLADVMFNLSMLSLEVGWVPGLVWGIKLFRRMFDQHTHSRAQKMGKIRSNFPTLANLAMPDRCVDEGSDKRASWPSRLGVGSAILPHKNCTATETPRCITRDTTAWGVDRPLAQIKGQWCKVVKARSTLWCCDLHWCHSSLLKNQMSPLWDADSNFWGWGRLLKSNVPHTSGSPRPPSTPNWAWHW